MSLSDKLARNTVDSQKFQQQWQTHLNMFGPLLAPMFAEDCASKIKLVDALNHLSQRKLGPAFRILNKLMLSCKTSEEKMGMLFFAGLSCEYAMDLPGARECYSQCIKYQPPFYLPYLRQAKLSFADRDFDAAEENFRQAAASIDSSEAFVNSEQIHAAVLVNDSRCLIAMHRYQEALLALNRAASIPGQEPSVIRSSKAMAYAAMGDEASCREELAWLQEHAPQVSASVEPVIQGILEGRDSQYRVREISREAIEAFWDWMLKNGSAIEKQPEGPISEKIQTVFPELSFTPDLHAEGRKITLKDSYNATLMEGYELLIEAMPQELKATWQFCQVR